MTKMLPKVAVLPLARAVRPSDASEGPNSATSQLSPRAGGFCEECGAPIEEDASYCDNCGGRTREPHRARRGIFVAVGAIAALAATVIVVVLARSCGGDYFEAVGSDTATTPQRTAPGGEADDGGAEVDDGTDADDAGRADASHAARPASVRHPFKFASQSPRVGGKMAFGDRRWQSGFEGGYGLVRPAEGEREVV
jgi:predicted nucleic acid-binding Zn ribbon protein